MPSREVFSCTCPNPPKSWSPLCSLDCNPLAFAAWLHPQIFAERLLQAALEDTITQDERDARLSVLREQLDGLRYQEEASLADGIRRSSSPWHVLGVRVEQQQAAA